MRILAVGDMHLGWTPSRLPEELVGQARSLGPGGAWERTVNVAVDAGVRAVLLAGDVVERENDFFEAYRELERGVKRLTGAGVQVIGVTGNHDVKVLPRLAQQIPEFQLLGAQGQWESRQIADDTGSITLWGWSFPRRTVRSSPLAGQTFDTGTGLHLGLLHCDRDVTDSPYAPVSSQELRQAGLDGWLLGHIHKPDALSAESLHGYLGSLTGLDRSETGVHGPWLIDVTGGRIERVEQLPLAPLRWEAVEVDLEGIVEPAQANTRVLDTLRELDRQIMEFSSSHELAATPDAVGVSLTLCGRTRFGAAALAEVVDSNSRGAVIPVGSGNRNYFIVKVSLATQPEIDLEELAGQPTPAGLLAQRLLWLDEPEGHPQRDELVSRASRRLRNQGQKPVWNGLDAAQPDAVEWLRKAGLRALDQLLAQNADVP